MKLDEAIKACRRLAASEPRILKVEADIRPEDQEDYALDLTFTIEGERFEAERRVVSLVGRLMDEFPRVPLDFMVLPSTIRTHGHGELIYSRQP